MANPGDEIKILYKYGAFAEAVDFSSFIPYLMQNDKNGSKCR